MKLTQSFVEKAEAPKNKDQIFYRDSSLKGFALRVTTRGVKSFVVETLINKKVRRITVGHYGKISAQKARLEAKKIFGKIAEGLDPIAERKISQIKMITMNQVFADYCKARKSLKPTTMYDYHRILNTSFADWRNKPLLNITKNMIAKRHCKIGERSPARANLAMRFLRALFNFTSGEYEDKDGKSLIVENPVKRLSHTRSWYKLERRQTIIKIHELSAWYNALMTLEDNHIKNPKMAFDEYGYATSSDVHYKVMGEKDNLYLALVPQQSHSKKLSSDDLKIVSGGSAGDAAG